MIGFNPYAPRAHSASGSDRRTQRVMASAQSGGTGQESSERRALIPQRRASDRRSQVAPRSIPSSSIAEASARAGVLVQTDFSAPRRGLRADAVERNRYTRAYDEASRSAPMVRPQLERSA